MIDRLLPGGFYHYLGSLTTPPCTPGVSWYVLKRKAVVCQRQIDRLSAVLTILQVTSPNTSPKPRPTPTPTPKPTPKPTHSAARRRCQQSRHPAVAPATSDHDAIERRVRRRFLRARAQCAALPAPRRLCRGTVKLFSLAVPSQDPPSSSLGSARARLLRLLRAHLAALSALALPGGETGRQASHRPGGSSQPPPKSPTPPPLAHPGAGLGVVAIWSRCGTAAWAEKSTLVAARAAGHCSEGRGPARLLRAAF